LFNILCCCINCLELQGKRLNVWLLHTGQTVKNMNCVEFGLWNAKGRFLSRIYVGRWLILKGGTWKVLIMVRNTGSAHAWHSLTIPLTTTKEHCTVEVYWGAERNSMDWLPPYPPSPCSALHFVFLQPLSHSVYTAVVITFIHNNVWLGLLEI